MKLDEYKEIDVHDVKEKILERIVLSDFEREECFKKGLVSTSYSHVFTGKMIGTSAYEGHAIKAKKTGAKLVLNNCSYYVFLDDLYFVVVEEPFTWGDYFNGENEVWIIPKNRFDAVRFHIEHREKTLDTRAEVVVSNGNTSSNIVKSGIVGGVIAGAPGAVVGALAASKKEPKTTTHRVGAVYDVEDDYVTVELFFDGMRWDLDAFRVDYVNNRIWENGEEVSINKYITGWNYDFNSYSSGELLSNYISIFRDYYSKQIEMAEKEKKEREENKLFCQNELERIKENPNYLEEKEKEKKEKHEQEMKRLNQEMISLTNQEESDREKNQREKERLNNLNKKLNDHLSELSLLAIKKKKEIKNQLEQVNRQQVELDNTMEIAQKEYQSKNLDLMGKIRIEKIAVEKSSESKDVIIERLETRINECDRSIEDLKKRIRAGNNAKKKINVYATETIGSAETGFFKGRIPVPVPIK